VTDPQQPEDEQRSEEAEAPAEQAPAEQAPVEEPAAEAPAEQAQAETAEEPAAEAPAEPAPAETAEAEPPAAEAAAAEAAEPEPPAPEPPADAGAAGAADQAPAPAAAPDEAADEVEVAPRQRPEIPGADLVPDIVSDGDEFLDAEARAGAEAEAEEAARAQDQDSDADQTRPIADAAIDLAAGARYTSTGKRKTAVARVILKPGSGTYSINGKELDAFFPRDTLRRVIRQPLEAVGYESRMDVVARMHGGGVAAQAGALRHGISKALIDADPNLRGELKRRGFLTRDPRVKERKKAGLKKARKRPQFSKR